MTPPSVVLSPPLPRPSPPLHSAPATGCSCTEHAQFSFPVRCSGEVTDTGWRLIGFGCRGGGWEGAEVDKMCQVPGKIRNCSKIHLQTLRSVQGPYKEIILGGEHEPREHGIELKKKNTKLAEL